MYPFHQGIKAILTTILTAGILVITLSCGGTASITSNFMSVESSLKRIQTEKNVPPDLTITYDDMHGLWGGTIILIDGSGNGERRERARGDRKPKIFSKPIPKEQLMELVRLLIEQEAWEQRTPERESVPDESRATLSISVGGQSVRIWEWFNDMEKNRRLSIIKAKMKQLTG